MAEPATNPKDKPLGWVNRIILIGLAAAAFYYFNSMPPGELALESDLIGHWVHQGDDVVVELIFHEDGRFDRYPKSVDLRTGAWGTSIPVAGEWVLQNRGVLVLVGAGSFKPYMNGHRLHLQAEGNSGIAFEFERKPLPPATRNVE
jgi:hypothetical protein